PSATTSVQGIVNFVQSNGSPMPEAISDPNISFWIPPSGSATFNLHNKGTLTAGYARIFSSGPVTADLGYQFPLLQTSGRAQRVTARSVSIPVTVGVSPLRNTGIAVVAQTAGNLVLSLTDSTGSAIAGGSQSIPVTAGQHVVAFVRELLPQVTQTQFTGT